MSARTLSEINRAQEAQIENLLGMVRELSAQQAAILQALTERRTTASETITLSRSKLADKATGVDVVIVPQNGETVKAAALRASEVFEGLAGRYPLPDGAAHAAPLGDDLDPWRQTLDGLHAVPDPEPAK